MVVNLLPLRQFLVPQPLLLPDLVLQHLPQLVSGLRIGHLDLRDHFAEGLARLDVVRGVVFRVCAKIGFFALFKIHSVFLLFGGLLILHLHFVELVHAFGCIFDFVEEAHLLQTVPLIRSIHHIQWPLRLQNHSSLLGTVHLVRSILNLRCVVHVSDLCWHVFGVLSVAKLCNNLVGVDS